eukprot:129147-Amphidinium_carterae.1
MSVEIPTQNQKSMRNLLNVALKIPKERRIAVGVSALKLHETEVNFPESAVQSLYENNIAREVVREGRQFFAFIEDSARGFSQEEAVTARSKCDYELSLHRKADARRQQEQFSQLQQTLRTSNEEEMVRHRHSVRSQYKHELRTELDSVKRELYLFQEANAETDSEQVTTLRAELLRAHQRNSLSEQRLVSRPGEITDAAQRQESTNYQLELRSEQVTSMNQTTVSELQQELVNAESYVTPRRIHIPTPDFGAVGTGASIQPSTSQSPLRFSLTPAGTGLEAGIQVCLEHRRV